MSFALWEIACHGSAVVREMSASNLLEVKAHSLRLLSYIICFLVSREEIEVHHAIFCNFDHCEQRSLRL